MQIHDIDQRVFFLLVLNRYSSDYLITHFNRGADPRARWLGAGLPADIRRAQSGQVPCSDALARQGKVLDEVSAAILADAQASARTYFSAGGFADPLQKRVIWY